MSEAARSADRWSARERAALITFALLSTLGPWAGWLVLRAWGWDRPWSMPLFVVAGSFCSLGGIAALHVQHGRPQAWRLLGEQLRLHGGWRPWALVLLWGPLWMGLAAVLQMAALGVGQAPEWSRLAAYAAPGVLFLFLTGPLGEEFGWRGYLLPALLQRWSFARASAVIGVWWALWHTPLMWDRWSADPLHAPYFVANVVLMSFMIGAVFRAGGLLPAMAVHWALNASQEVVPAVFGLQGWADRRGWLLASLALVAVAALGGWLLARGRRASVAAGAATGSGATASDRR